MTENDLIEHLEHTIAVLHEYVYRYEAALKEIAGTPSESWQHRRLVNIAKEALKDGA